MFIPSLIDIGVLSQLFPPVSDDLNRWYSNIHSKEKNATKMFEWRVTDMTFTQENRGHMLFKTKYHIISFVISATFMFFFFFIPKPNQNNINIVQQMQDAWQLTFVGKQLCPQGFYIGVARQGHQTSPILQFSSVPGASKWLSENRSCICDTYKKSKKIV